MRCRDVDVLWDDVRGECQASLKDAVETHLSGCTHCQEIYEEYEGVAFCLSRLPQPEPSCDLAKRVVEHIAAAKHKGATAIALASLKTPVGKLYVGFKDGRIGYIGIDTGETFAAVQARVETRLHRPVVAAEPPAWLEHTLEQFFKTWQVDDTVIDISSLTAFEQAALRAAARIPPGEVRSYGWVASQIGRPRAARAVGRAMARNPLPLLLPCHRVVDSTGDLHNYGYGLEMKATLLRMEGYRTER
ncbi:MAG: methylated-DNA--[protein]-cysteine S-methyltransferase [Vulcanimicrobiaceae bacterium]